VRRDDDDISALRPYPPEMLVYHGVTVLKLFWERDEFEYGYGDEDDSDDEEVCGAVGHGGDFFVRHDQRMLSLVEGLFQSRPQRCLRELLHAGFGCAL
jgi:hypothetical protein